LHSQKEEQFSHIKSLIKIVQNNISFQIRCYFFWIRCFALCVCHTTPTQSTVLFVCLSSVCATTTDCLFDPKMWHSIQWLSQGQSDALSGVLTKFRNLTITR